MNLRHNLTALLLMAYAAVAHAGDFSGQYTFDGDVPKLAPLVAAGAANCTPAAIPDTSLVVDSTTKGIANVVVFLPKAPSGTPDLGTKPAPVLDQKACEFLPRILPVRAGQIPLVKSNDAVPHNVRSTFIRNKSFNFVVGGINRVGIPCPGIDTAEPLPMPIKCDLHPYMRAYWVILDHPYVAVTDKDGKFTIKDLPPGKHKFRVWHERAGYIDRSLTVDIPNAGNVALPVEPVSSKEFK